MIKLFEKLNALSWSTVLFIAGGLTIASGLPLWMYVANQQTHIVSKAIAPTPISSLVLSPTPTDGPIPTNPPTLTRVYPWIGKVGDTIIIEGTHFGTYPKNRQLTIAGQIVSDDQISSWTDTQIIASIPSSPIQGKPLTLTIGTYPSIESVPLVFYDASATVRLTKTNMTISASGLTGIVTITLITKNENSFDVDSAFAPQSGTSADKQEITITAKPNEPTVLFTLQPSEEILSLMLTDGKGTVIPYSLNPTDFGF